MINEYDNGKLSMKLEGLIRDIDISGMDSEDIIHLKDRKLASLFGYDVRNFLVKLLTGNRTPAYTGSEIRQILIRNNLADDRNANDYVEEFIRGGTTHIVRGHSMSGEGYEFEESGMNHNREMTYKIKRFHYSSIMD